MNHLELRAWISFADMLKNFLGNRRAENCEELVQMLLKILQDIGTNVRIKAHFYIAI